MKTSEIEIGKTYAYVPFKGMRGEAATVVARDLKSAYEGLTDEERVEMDRLCHMSRPSETVLVDLKGNYTGSVRRVFVSPRKLEESWDEYHARAEMMRRLEAERDVRRRALRDAWEQEKVVIVETLREYGVEGFIDIRNICADLSGKPEITLSREQILALISNLKAA